MLSRRLKENHANVLSSTKLKTCSSHYLQIDKGSFQEEKVMSNLIITLHAGLGTQGSSESFPHLQLAIVGICICGHILEQGQGRKKVSMC